MQTILFWLPDIDSLRSQYGASVLDKAAAK